MEPKKLGRPTDQRLAVLRNQASELLWYGKIETTVDRAKSVRSIAEKLITLAINTYEDTVKVTKTKTNLKGEKVEVEFTNDGPKKLAARRKMIAELRDIPEAKEEKESKTAYAKRTPISSSIKSCQSMRMTFWLKWMNTTLSMPKQRFMMSFLPMALFISGTSVPKTSVSGWTSKVSTDGIAPISCARCFVLLRSAA